MSTKAKFLVIILVGAALLGGAYLYVTRPVAAPSAPIGGIPGGSQASAGEGQVRYRIDPAATKATFRLDEVLRGKPFTVIGETDQVAADILLDAEAPANTRVPEIRINARTLKTDSPQRDGAISRLILRSEDPANEFIVFKPTALEGLPARIVSGTAFGFRVAGDLTIAGITKPATFQGSATLTEENRLVGSASATVRRGDFNLTIPNVPFVANVEEEVELQLEFAAVRIP